MTKEEFLAMWKEELKSCEEQYKFDAQRVNDWYKDYHSGRYRRGGPPKSPDHTIFRNRLSSRLSHIYKEELEQLPEDVRLDIEKTATTMMLDKMREMEVEIKYDDDLERYIKLDPKNIQYMDLLNWNADEKSFFAKMVAEKPEVLNFLTAEQFNEISKGNPEYIVQLVQGNVGLANRPPLSEIIANDPALTKEITILKKEDELNKLKSEVAAKEEELEQLKGEAEIEVQSPTEIE